MHDKQTYNVISWLSQSQSQSQSHAGISVINQSRKWRRAPFCAPAWFMCFFHSVITTFSSLFTHFVLFLHLVDFFFFHSAAFLLFFSFVTFSLCCQYLRSSFCTLRFLCQRNFYVLFLQWKTLNWVCRKWWINQSTQQWWTKNKVNVMRNAKIKEKHERRKWTTEERGHSRFNGRLFVYMVLSSMNAYIVFMHLNSKWWGIFCFNFC